MVPRMPKIMEMKVRRHDIADCLLRPAPDPRKVPPGGRHPVRTNENPTLRSGLRKIGLNDARSQASGTAAARWSGHQLRSSAP